MANRRTFLNFNRLTRFFIYFIMLFINNRERLIYSRGLMIKDQTGRRFTPPKVLYLSPSLSCSETKTKTRRRMPDASVAVPDRVPIFIYFYRINSRAINLIYSHFEDSPNSWTAIGN